MPPKKDAKKGGEAEPELGPEEMLLRSKLRIESLERELVARSEAMNKAVAEQMKMRQKVAEFHQDFVKEKQDTFAITSDMTRQYKQMQEDLLRRNNEQQLQIEDLKDQVQLFSLGFCYHVNRRSIFIKSAQTLSPTLVFDAMKSRKTI